MMLKSMRRYNPLESLVGTVVQQSRLFEAQSEIKRLHAKLVAKEASAENLPAALSSRDVANHEHSELANRVPKTPPTFEKAAASLQPIDYLTVDMADVAVAIAGDAKRRAEMHPNGAPMAEADQYWLQVGASAAMIIRASRVCRGQVDPPLPARGSYARMILNAGRKARGLPPEE